MSKLYKILGWKEKIRHAFSFVEDTKSSQFYSSSGQLVPGCSIKELILLESIIKRLHDAPTLRAEERREKKWGKLLLWGNKTRSGVRCS